MIHLNLVAARWLPIFAVLAILYIASEPLRPYPLHFLVKALPIVVLAVYTCANLNGLPRRLLLAALLFSAGGDVMLSMSFPNQFIAGLGSFLIAQLIYTVIFLRACKRERPAAKSALSIAVLLYSLTMANLILPDDAATRIAVLCYITVITAMAITAGWAWRGSLLHVVGALLFVLSDSLIAWHSFRSPVPFSSLLIMSTYYAAQAMLASGIVQLSRRDPG